MLSKTKEIHFLAFVTNSIQETILGFRLMFRLISFYEKANFVIQLEKGPFFSLIAKSELRIKSPCIIVQKKEGKCSFCLFRDEPFVFLFFQVEQILFLAENH